MSKYIFVDRLIAEIEKYENTAIEVYDPHGEDADFWYGRVVACEDLKAIITSLQQEQPMPDSTKLIELWHEDKEMLKEKDFRDDPWRLAYNAFMCGFGRGLAVKHEQPEVDFEKEFQEYWYLHRYDNRLRRLIVDGHGKAVLKNVASHFFELGRNARKGKKV